jgi:Zn-dependent protease
MKIRGVPVYAHWSLLLVGVLVLIGALEQPAEMLTGWCSYFSVILLHECGHMVLAERRGYHVLAIELYPILGRVRFERPRSRLDQAFIAWGGVAAQALVAVPLVAWVSLFGFSRFPLLNLAMGILGYYNLLVAAFNLIPLPPLDGAIAWSLLPQLVKRARAGN